MCGPEQYLKGRFYSPAWHRFLNSIHGVDPTMLNQYACTPGSPLMVTDPAGMDAGTGADHIEFYA
jgi:hypothetical protein